MRRTVFLFFVTILPLGKLWSQYRSNSKYIDYKLRDSIFDHQLYIEKLVKDGFGARWSVEDDRILSKVEAYNTIIKLFDTSILLKPIFQFRKNGTVRVKEVLFKGSAIVFSSNICSNGYLLRYGKRAYKDKNLPLELIPRIYSVEFGEYKKSEPVNDHYIFNPDFPNILIRYNYKDYPFIITDTLYGR